MNFFVRIVTAPSDMVEKYLQPQGSCGELRLATDGAGAHDRLRRGTMARGPIAGGHRNGLHGYLLLEGSRCRGTGLGGGAYSDGRPPLASPIPREGVYYKYGSRTVRMTDFGGKGGGEGHMHKRARHASAA